MENEGTKRDAKNMMKDQMRHKCSNEEENCPQSKIDTSVTPFRFVKKLCDVCFLCGKSAVYKCPKTGEYHRRSYNTRDVNGNYVKDTLSRKKKI
jgi:hypothetical protein